MKLGERRQVLLNKENLKWLENFKIAVIEEDFDTIGEMVNSMPIFDTLKQNEEALALVKEANQRATRQRELILAQMQKAKKAKNFFQSEERKNFEVSL